MLAPLKTMDLEKICYCTHFIRNSEYSGPDYRVFFYIKKGGVLKYLRFSKILFQGQKRKKIFTDTPVFGD